MRRLIMDEFDITKTSKDYTRITYKNLLKFAKDLQINYVCLKDSEIVTLNNGTYKRIYTTKNSPFLIEKDDIFHKNILYINSDYFKNHQNKVQKILKTLIGNIKIDEFSIEDKELINNTIIKALSKNKSLKKVSLTEYAKDNKYVLSKEDYEILKNSSIEKIKTNAVSDSLLENFDPIISFNYDKPLISSYSYGRLTNEEDTLFLKKITVSDLENLKYLKNPNLILEVEENNVEDVLSISKRLKELGKENNVVIRAKNKDKIFARIKENEAYRQDNIYIDIKTEIYPLKDFLNYETTLYEIVEPTKDLSPFEKYIYIFNVVKQFKYYKENENDKRLSRNLYDILNNEYIVCVGYSVLLRDLLKKVGINSIGISISVDTSYDDDNTITSTTRSGHARAYIYIIDPKYNIDGFYIADPTWNNFMHEDIYTHLALTNEEETYTRRYNFIGSNIDTSELFNVKSLKEFYSKIDFFTSRISLEKENIFKLYDNPNYISQIIIDLLTSLQKLSPEFTNQLKNKYKELEKYLYNQKYEHEKEILNEIGNYIVSKVNKPISGKTIMTAVKEVYQKAYYIEGPALENLVKDIAKDNHEYQKIQFPKRYKIDEFGNKTELPNISDKFDLEENKRTR